MAREANRLNDPAREPQRRRALWLPGVGAVVVLAVLAGLTLGGTPAQAAFPGSNGKLFCEEAAAPGGTAKDVDIFSINPDGTGRMLVTDNTLINPADPNSGFLNDLHPAISADGKKMAFISNRDGALSTYVMNADGTGPATLVSSPPDGAFGELFPAWTPDGKKILFTALFPGGNGEIYIVNVDGSNPTNLTNRTTQEVAPAVSPDGKKILFHSNRNFTPTTARDQDIYSMDLDGSNVQNLTNDSNADALDVFATWSPDGKQFVFERGQNSGTSSFAFSNVFTMKADGTGTPTQLTFATAVPGSPANSQLNRNPTWSPDGTRIAFDSERDNQPSPAPRNREAYTMKTDGSDVRNVTNAPGSDSNCDWQTIPRPAIVRPPVYPLPKPGTLPGFAGCPSTSVNLILGTNGNDTRTGTTAGDRILVGTGNDIVDGLPGDDCIDLGPGNDRGQGGLGADLMLAGRGNDRVSGSSGNDRIRGNSGNDRLNGGRGNDRVFGDAGNDTLLGSFGNDVLHGVSGKDVIGGSRGRDRINGGSGNDRISGGSSNDRISGDAGNDRINGNSGADRIKGNSGNDRITSLDNQRDRVNCGSGRDSVLADRKDIVAGNCERVRRR